MGGPMGEGGGEGCVWRSTMWSIEQGARSMDTMLHMEQRPSTRAIYVACLRLSSVAPKALQFARGVGLAFTSYVLLCGLGSICNVKIVGPHI